MSATTALGTAPPEAAAELAAAANQMPQSGEDVRSHAERGNEIAVEVDADDTIDATEEETVIADEVPASGEDSRPAARPGKEEVTRREAATRVRQSVALPPGLRERLAALVESGGQVVGEGQTLISIDEAVRAVAETLPSTVRLGGSEVAQSEHPSGESFFSGRTAEEMTDQQAEELARGQLARSGLLRGQRVRVAQD